jgi:hypothetical protein
MEAPPIWTLLLVVTVIVAWLVVTLLRRIE